MSVSTQMQQLIDAVAAEDTIIDSAIAFINGLAPLIESAAGDRTASLALAADVRKRGQALADAIVANTPQEPPPGLPTSFADRAAFDTAVADYVGGSDVQLDGVSVKAGTVPSLVFYTKADGSIDNVGPTGA
jgi:hypothetical protein